MRRLALLVTFTLVACGTPASMTDAGVAVDSGVPDAGPSCSSSPTTHLEIINACTSAVAIVRTPSLPLLQADGGVPPLP
jgi:hypothetical protein